MYFNSQFQNLFLQKRCLAPHPIDSAFYFSAYFCLWWFEGFFCFCDFILLTFPDILREKNYCYCCFLSNPQNLGHQLANNNHWMFLEWFSNHWMTNLDSILKNWDIALSTKVHLVKAMVFPVVMYGCESWTIKKAERQRIDASELWYWRRLLRVPWTARRSNQSILKEISPGCSSEGLMLKLKL